MYKVRPSELVTQNNMMGDFDLAGWFISWQIARRYLVKAKKILKF